jgi:hypothetical protein
MVRPAETKMGGRQIHRCRHFDTSITSAKREISRSNRLGAQAKLALLVVDLYSNYAAAEVDPRFIAIYCRGCCRWIMIQ